MCYNPSYMVERGIGVVRSGAVFGRLRVLCPDAKQRKVARSNTWWICRCDCGVLTPVRADKLAYNGTKSCGCTALKRVKACAARWNGILDKQQAIMDAKLALQSEFEEIVKRYERNEA